MELAKHFNTKNDKFLITVIPTDDQINNLRFVCNQLEKVREKFGAINVTSGLRPAKAKYSQHEEGFAVDFQIYNVDLFEVYKWIVNNMKFDQLIYEKDYNNNIWIHFSTKEIGNRNEALIADVRKKNTLYVKFYNVN